MTQLAETDAVLLDGWWRGAHHLATGHPRAVHSLVHGQDLPEARDGTWAP